MKRTCTLIFILLATTFISRGQQKQQVALTAEDSVRSIIASLPEVQAKDKVYDSLTNRMQNIIIKVTAPDSTVTLYRVEAGYQGNTRFQPHFYFFVDLVNDMIYIEDFDKGDRTTLDEWRNRRKAPNAENK